MSVPQINHKSLRDPQKKLARLEAELKEARRVAEVNAAAKSAAEEADKKAREEAYLANRSQPSPTAPPVVERLAAGERTAADLQGAVEKAKAQLEQAIAENRADIKAKLREDISKDNVDYDELLDQLEAVEVGKRLHEAEDRAASGGRKWLPRHDALVPDLSQPNGEDRRISEVFAALRSRSRPPEPKLGTGAAAFPVRGRPRRVRVMSSDEGGLDARSE